MQTALLLVVPLLPLGFALVRWFLFPRDDGKTVNVFQAATLAVNLVLSVVLIFQGDCELTVAELMGMLPVVLKSDLLSRVFLALVSVMWLLSGWFSFGYMKHEPQGRRRYDTFFLLTLFALNGLCLSGTLVTMYLFFEMMTLLSIVMVIHTGSKEAVAAGIKYLLYSVAGAMLGLLGIFFLVPASESQIFTPGGMLSGNVPLWVILLAVIGFGAKAGMFPLHGWLPTAHPIAPAPASAVLSGVITKMGVLCIIRILYYVAGPAYLQGTWVQTVLLSLALLTVFMGSMMAFSVTGFKKRLAYSTISQVSYILFGLFMFQQECFVGSILHLIFHGVMKNLLFLSAGAVICKTGLTDVRELSGIGKRMPVTMWCFTLAGVGLVGIPPLAGFLSKWKLVTGSLASGIPVLSWLGPVTLLVSALLTAGYLLPVSISAFFPGSGAKEELSHQEASPVMLAVLLLLTIALVVLGLWPNPVLDAANALASGLM